MTDLKERYDQLEQDVHNKLRHLIQRDGLESKHGQFRAIHAGVFDYHELAVINDRLTFLDKQGYHYGLYDECSLEDLIDIVNSCE
jgi:hypothetical protein